MAALILSALAQERTMVLGSLVGLGAALYVLPKSVGPIAYECK